MNVNLLLSILIVFGALNSFACADFPKKISIKNSTFPFSEFEINGGGFFFKDPEDGSEIYIACDSEKK